MIVISEDGTLTIDGVKTAPIQRGLPAWAWTDSGSGFNEAGWQPSAK